jgi:L-fucose isomerase-like protein
MAQRTRRAQSPENAMKQRKSSIGVLAVGRATFDVDFAAAVFEQAWQGLQRLDAGLVGEPRIHYEADAALAAFESLQASDIDLLLVVQVTFTDAAVVTAIAERLDVPLVVWTFPEQRTGGRLRLNSFCGANLAAHTLSRRGKALENVHGAPDSVEVLGQIDVAAKAAAIVRDLSRSRILVVGDHPTGFDACNFKADELRERFGVETVTTPVKAFLDSVKALPDAVADAPYARRARDFANLGEMDQVATRKTLKAYSALKSRAENEGFAGVAVRCWPEFFTEYGCAACGAIALMNEDGRPGGCEADVFGVISSLVLQSASGQGVFNTDLVDVDPVSDTVVFWHCGQAPLEMADPDVAPRETIHSNRKLPLLSEFPLKPGRITLCRITQGEGKLRMMLSGGEMIKAPLAFSGTSGVARLDVPADQYRSRLLEQGMEHHSSLAYGEYRPVLRRVAKQLGLELVELT